MPSTTTSPLLPSLPHHRPPHLQSASTVRNSPTVRFGTSTRDQEAKVFISQEHEKGAYGTCRWGEGVEGGVS